MWLVLVGKMLHNFIYLYIAANWCFGKFVTFWMCVCLKRKSKGQNSKEREKYYLKMYIAYNRHTIYILFTKLKHSWYVFLMAQWLFSYLVLY